MPAAVIEIEVTPVDPARMAPRRPRAPAVALVLAGLVLLLTGPALVRPTYLPPVWQMASTSRYFWLTADTVYSIDVGQGVWLRARDPGTGRNRWAVRLNGPLADVYGRRDVVLTSNFPPSPADGLRTEVFDTDGGLARLSFPVAALPLAYIGSRVAISVDRDVSVPAREDADAWIRARGLQWTYVATALDIRTGDVQWVRTLPPGVVWWLPGVRVGTEGIVGLPAGQDWMATVRPDGVVEVWDLLTGHTMSWRRLNAASTDDWSYVSASADAIVVRSGRSPNLVAYDPLTLNQVWSFLPPEAYAEPVTCQPVLCLVTSTSVWLADPRTGATPWQASGPQVRPGSAGRVLLTGYGAQLVLVDPATGRHLAVEADWRMVDAGAYTRQVVLAQLQGGHGAHIGLLDVGSGQIRPVGQVSRWSPATLCLSAGSAVVCGDGERLLMWRI